MAVTHVAPTIPTVAGDVERWPLIGTDLWSFFYIENIHVVPTVIDLARFSAALAKTLSVFPTFAGRLRHAKDKGEWWIQLTNSPVPITFVNNCSVPAPPAEWVVIDHLQPFVAPIEPPFLINNDKPLLSVKLSIIPTSGETVIGLMASHIIADGQQMLDFTRTLSECYANEAFEPNRDISLPQSVDLTLLKITDSPSTSEDTPPSFWDARHFDGPAAQSLYFSDFQNASPVHLHISPAQADLLRRRAIQGLNEKDGKTISRQDVISAFVVSVLNQFLSKPITYVGNNLNYRGIVAPSYVGTNATAFIYTRILATSTDYHSITTLALAIRHSIVQARNKDTLERNLSYAQKTMVNVANERRIYAVLPAEGSAMINANSQYDWNAVDFGHPGQVHFHTSWLASRYIRVFRSNPTQLDAREGWVDVQFKVDKEIRKEITSAFEEELNALQ